MNQKYEITDIVHPQYPWLHRIRALRDVREDVHAGDLGGFVQSEENLSQEGQCWIATNPIYPVTPSCGITPALVVVQSFPEKAESVEKPS